ncbi:hypothetical protein NEOLEDRAFT_1177964 [Neolentinus lepideus HHB14362 ss-1]|uniref:Uncharacterized protein n=1 Tax=Neolentinus lepideus HHB14362 ss-1 TaxID=1314782 RepID=A0A165T5U5_9AGAM|nr:hypothetical protein NEOLEDRAFT_1177964 [Neolentinus lepideus HHB14362 ss-1]
MLIRLVPQPPSPTVLFTLSFPSLAQSLPPPPSWHLQLQRLATSELELPASMHALDKSAWVVCVLQEVTFDLCAETITCVFVDGQREEWPIVGGTANRCVKALESVLDDVNSSARENEKERVTSVEENHQPHSRQVSSSSVNSNSAPVKHKKQRSLLMSLVASLVPHSSHHHPPIHTYEPPVPPAPVQAPPQPPLLPSQIPLSGKQLRRRARSTLTDTYRLFVLPELLSRLSPGGYYTWILQSMIGRAQRRMRELAEERGLREMRMPDGQIGWTCGRQIVAGNEAEGEGDMFWDEDDEGLGDSESLETETDGSSVHTPTDTVHDSLPLVAPPSPISPKQQRDSYFPPPTLPPPSPAPSHPSNTPGKRAHTRSYTSAGPHPPLSRLTHLLHVHMNVQQSITAEQEHVLSVLEIKSRRRAWSNGARVGILGALGHGASGLGLSMPVQSSPLARCMLVSAGDEWVSVWDEEEQCWEEEQSRTLSRPLSPTFGGHGKLEIVSRESDMACLFPVSEDDDEEGMEDVPLGEWIQRQHQGQLPAYSAANPDTPEDHPFAEDDGANMHSRRSSSPPPPNVRRRTKSMRAALHPPPVPLNSRTPLSTSISAPDHLDLLDHDRPVLHPLPQLSASSLLCQPLSKKHTAIDHGEGEFTLAMDLPRKVKVRGTGGYDDENWLTMRSSEPLSRC